jgi:L-rhamnose isomerase
VSYKVQQRQVSVVKCVKEVGHWDAVWHEFCDRLQTAIEQGWVSRVMPYEELSKQAGNGASSGYSNMLVGVRSS